MTKAKTLSIMIAALASISSLGLNAFAEASYALGDVDMDGVVTGHDTAMVSRYLLEDSYTLTEDQLALADVDGDGEVAQADADKMFGEMQESLLGDVETAYSFPYLHISDASLVLEAYSYIGAGLDTGFTEVQKNLADASLDGVIDLQDVQLILGLYVLYAADITDGAPIEGVYYYSEDPDSPAYIGSLYGTNLNDDGESA